MRTLTGITTSFEAIALANIAREKGKVCHISLSDKASAVLKDSLRFFAPDITVYEFPALDTVPYDRSSPNTEITAERIKTLSALSSDTLPDKVILLTTVNASMGKVPPVSYFKDTVWHIKEGEKLDLDKFKKFLTLYGYSRVEQVMQKGEYAIRGGIIDIFPSGSDTALRLDMFGDEIDKIRTFDVVSQISSGTIGQFTFLPASEVSLNPDTISLFRTKYRNLFGSMIAGDELYESVSQGRRFMGLEHWLSLFYPSLDTLFDYIKGFTLTRSFQAASAVISRQEQIADFYHARMEALEIACNGKVKNDFSGFIYRPVPPSDMFVVSDEYNTRLDSFTVFDFSPFADGKNPDLGSKPAYDFSVARQNPDVDLIAEVKDTLNADIKAGKIVLISAYSEGASEALSRLLKEKGVYYDFAATYAEALEKGRKTKKPVRVVLAAESGFISPDLVLLTKDDILGESLARPALKRKKSAKDLISDISSLNIGDLLVHLEHGIGKYEGLMTIQAGGASHDCLLLTYSGGDKLYVPVENIDVLSRFGSEEAGVRLDSLGSGAWQARKSALKKRIKEMADKLMKIAALRYLKKTEALLPPSPSYAEFVAKFPYTETDDQENCIEDVMADLSAGRPMDRLICGDVGFGKTEIAIRAAFVAAMAGYQVAVLAPTTLLARQHYEVFSERFKGTPVRIGQLSRIVSAKDAALVKSELEKGTLDIVIGTHALLQKTVKFKRLGLMVVDEEQHFGVAHKERIKELSDDIHILTLTATPIPRTLQLALSGVRQMSIIATPPIDRLAVRSFVTPYDSVIIKEAVLRELFRGGQVFYVCPKIGDIAGVVESLKELIPDVRVISAHGQLSPSELEKRISDFTSRKYDILVATSIIESGIDMPSVNTLIVHRADMFGLAQLYQLRGRVGRSKIRAYAYFTIKGELGKLTPAAEKRLSVMQSLDSLGEGFNLAGYDLDIRGAGNLLGEEQSGHIKEVGIELYQKMLEEAVAALKSGNVDDDQEAFSPIVNTGVPVLIPESYIGDLSLRLSLYRRLADLTDTAQVTDITSEIVDRFGKIPPELDNLLTVIYIKILAKKANIERIEAGDKGAVVTLYKGLFPNPEGLVKFISSQAGTVKIKEGDKLVWLRNWTKPSERLAGVRFLTEQLAAIADK